MLFSLVSQVPSGREQQHNDEDTVVDESEKREVEDKKEAANKTAAVSFFPFHSVHQSSFVMQRELRRTVWGSRVWEREGGVHLWVGGVAGDQGVELLTLCRRPENWLPPYMRASPRGASA